MGRFLEERRLLGISFGSLRHGACCGDGRDEGLLERGRGRCRESRSGIECSTPGSMRNPAGRDDLLSLRHGAVVDDTVKGIEVLLWSSTLPSVHAGLRILRALGSADSMYVAHYCNRSYKKHCILSRRMVHWVVIHCSSKP